MDNITTIAQMVAEVVITQLEESATMTDIEHMTHQIINQIGQQALEKFINTQVPAYPEPYSSCSCGEKATDSTGIQGVHPDMEIK